MNTHFNHPKDKTADEYMILADECVHRIRMTLKTNSYIF